MACDWSRLARHLAPGAALRNRAEQHPRTGFAGGNLSTPYCTGMVTGPNTVLAGDVTPPIWSEMGTALPVWAL